MEEKQVNGVESLRGLGLGEGEAVCYCVCF